uniref:Uncharacterized protein n=1 Tax=Bosea sp. NBC_00436 TaxID=2969620 RepID=A0A9E7ZKK4_9HYPH
MKNVVIAILAALVVFLSARLVSIENQRYAAVMGMCPDKFVPRMQDPVCLAKVETRTSWLWHLFYALQG